MLYIARQCLPLLSTERSPDAEVENQASKNRVARTAKYPACEVSWPWGARPLQSFRIEEVNEGVWPGAGHWRDSLVERRMVCDERWPNTHSQGKPMPWYSCPRRHEIE